MSKNHKKGGVALAPRLSVRPKRASITVSYPCDGETIAYPSYTLQVNAAGEASGVDVCIDQGEWLPCRESLGLWWYDWAGYDSGEHEIVARMRKADGTTESSEPRIFFVKLP